MAQIICEIGQNHLGKMTLARTLIKLAKENGADLAKFQLYNTDALYEKGTELYQQAKEAELTFEQAKMLFDYGKEVGIEVFFSVFDVERVQWCERIGIKRYKISAKNKDKSLWSKVEETGKPCIISYDPNYDKWGWDEKWLVLYCVAEYPARLIHFGQGMFEDTGGVLGSIDGRGEYHKEYDGFSDHTIGLDAAKIALARGAQIIEKHFCLSHYVGVDGMWSMTPEDLKELKRWEQVCRKVL